MIKFLQSLLTVLLFSSLSACEISESIEIQAPPEAVWAYLGDNTHAADWSVYFKSIRTLSSPSSSDAAIGSIRRCYRGDDEAQAFWDELTLEVDAPKYRKILSYNFSGYKNPLLRQAQFVVHNRLEAIAGHGTRLTFANSIWSPLTPSALLEFAGFSGAIKHTLRLNLENIKAAIEAQQGQVSYRRVHEYQAPGSHTLDNL